jgi:carbamoyl-phosphate synthase large subunit
MKEITIGVSGINAVDNPGPGVGVIRALREEPGLKLKIVGLAYDAMEPGIYLDWLVDRTYVLPYPSGDHGAYLERLHGIKQACGLDFIFPTLDVELPFYIKRASELEGLGIRTFLPNLEQFQLRGKDRLADVAEKIGLEIPATHVVHSFDGLMAAIETIGLPVMVKGAFYNAFQAHTTQEAAGYYHKIVAEWGYPIIVQQVVRGDEMNVVGVGDGRGGSLGMLGIKKMTTTALGKIWTGATVKNGPMLQAAEKFIQEFKWKGAFELECMVQGNTVWLIEINPRFPAWSYCSAALGINLPLNILRHSLGLPSAPAVDYDAGKLFIRYTYEVVTDMDKFRSLVTKGEC